MTAICRLDLSRAELAYLILQADIGGRAALARIEGSEAKVADCAAELVLAAQIFARGQGPFALKRLVDRMSQLVRARVST